MVNMTELNLITPEKAKYWQVVHCVEYSVEMFENHKDALIEVQKCKEIDEIFAYAENAYFDIEAKKVII